MGKKVDVFFVFLLIFTEIILLSVAWYIFDGDFISPSVVTIALFTISTVCFAYKTNEWIVGFSCRAYMLFTLSFVLMIATEKWISRHQIILKCERYDHHHRTNNVEMQRNVLYIPRPLDIILFIFFCLCAFFYVYRVYMSGVSLGATSLLTSIGINKEEGDYDGLTRLFYNITRIASYVYVVMFCNNVLACKENVKKNIFSLIIIVLSVIITFFSGQRSVAICYIMGIVVAASISLYDAQKQMKKVNVKEYFRKFILTGIIVIILFYLSSNIVKGTNIQREFVDYMTYYFGSTVALMGRIVENPSICHTQFTGYFGEKTFNGFWSTMYSLGIVSTQPCERVWIKMGDSIARRAGNEYTFFCGPYIDFGFFGTLVFIVLFYAFFSYIYYWKIKKVDFTIKKYTTCAIYIFLYGMVAMSFYQDTIRSYSRPINLAYILYIILFCKLFIKISRRDDI